MHFTCIVNQAIEWDFFQIKTSFQSVCESTYQMLHAFHHKAENISGTNVIKIFFRRHNFTVNSGQSGTLRHPDESISPFKSNSMNFTPGLIRTARCQSVFYPIPSVSGVDWTANFIS